LHSFMPFNMARCSRILCQGEDRWPVPHPRRPPVGEKRKDERGSGAYLLCARAFSNHPSSRRNVGNVKAVSAPAASPIRCETSQGTNRISVLPRCGSRPPGGGRGPWPASPDRTKHIGHGALRVPPESGLLLSRRRCVGDPARPIQG